MTLRVTRQFGEVLGTGGGDARVTRQYLEVLGTTGAIFNQPLTSNMVLTQDVHVPVRIERLTSNLSLTSNVVEKVHLRESLTSNISFTQGFSRTQEASITSNLTMAGETGTYLGQGESFMLDNTLNMTSEVVTSGLLQAIGSTISISQQVEVQAPNYQYMASVMHLISEVGQPAFEKNLSVNNTIVFTQIASRPYYGTASTTINLVSEAWWSERPTSTLNLIQTTDYGKTKGMEVGAMDLVQTIVLTGDWSRAINQDLGLGHSLTYYIPDPCGKKAYTPYLGESSISSNPTPPDEDLPFVQGLPEGERFQLLYPGIGEATDTVELRAPNLDNRERLAFTRINRETRGGRLTVFADPIWPQINTLVLSFTGLTKTEVDDVQAFLANHLGKEVGLIDWEGRQWVGLITSPTEPAVQDGGGACGGRFTISLEFEGVLLDDMPSGSHMTITGTVVAVLN